jgi:uncharacterized protein
MSATRPEAHALAYFDTSVLVKRYVRERGAAQARALLQDRQFLSSAITPVEAVSALSRRRAAGDLSRASFDAILAQLARDRRFWALVEVTSGILDRAETVIRETGARTLDAIHLASAVQVQTGAGSPGLHLVFVTADAVQHDAALRLGLEVHHVR